MGGEDENPFRLPTDDQWFFFQEQEVQKREEELERVRHQKVYEKTTASQRVARTLGCEEVQMSRPSSLTPSGDEPGAQRRALSEGGQRASREPREKGGVQSYVAKKHEVFLAQMSLNVKKAEIVKLDERATRKEEALKGSQKMLDEDIKRFEDFLQSKDKKAHTAMKNAEEMAKKKMDKLHRIKQLKTQLSGLQNEIAKLRESKDECLSLKAFLEALTPQAWIDAKGEEKVERKRSRMRSWVDKKYEESSAKMKTEIDAEEKAFEEKAAEAMTRGRRRPKRELEEEQKEREKELETRRRRIQKKYATRDSLEKKYRDEFGDDSSGEDMPLYFKEPKQLLDVFTAMEEANLFLIQNTQDTEQSLEECQQNAAETTREGEIAREKTEQQIASLEKQIRDEKLKRQELRQKIAQQDSASDQEALARYLCENALEVYLASGHEAERDPDTLQMLAAVEAKIEEFLAVFDEAEEVCFNKLIEIERAAETQRREMGKKLRKEQQDRKIEERLKASLLRSQAPIHKKTGKQIMFRSPPAYTAQRVVEEDDGYEEAMHEHRIFGIWTGKDGAPNASVPSRPA